MKLLDMGKNLGQAISNSKEYARLLEAQKLYKEDNEAMALVKRFKQIQQVLSSGGSSAYDIETRKELTKLYNDIEINKVIRELNKALDEFLILKQEVYDSIEAYINIDDDIVLLNNRRGCKGSCSGCKK